MLSINIDSIMDKIRAFGQSASGKSLMKETIQNYIDEGIGKTQAGDKIRTEADMFEAASKFIQVLRNTVQSYDLPQSVMRHFDFIDSSITKHSDGSATIYIYFDFDDHLHRESLYPKD